MGKRKSFLINSGVLFGIIIGATITGKVFVLVGIPETNIVVIYILAVLLIARFTKGYGCGILSSVVSILCFNYFFTAPYHTFAVADPGYLVTFFIMLVTAFVTSALTTKEKLLTKEAMEKGMENQTLYMLSNQLSDAADIETVIQIAAESVSRLLQVDVGCIYVARQTDAVFIQQLDTEQIHRSVPDIEGIRRSFTNLRTEYREEKEYYCYPVNGHEKLLAVIKIKKQVSRELLRQKKELLHSVIENIALALERIEITMERIEDRQRMERERERANLLRAISHDLRTPLSGIMGTSEMLMDMTDKEDRRQPLLKGIYQDADWLKSLVENILSLTRLQDGRVLIHKEPEALEEIIGCAVAHIEKGYPGREIQVELPDDFILVPVDAKLIEQVVTNLLDNAIKHTAPEGEIKISVAYEASEARVSVRDEGEGIAEADLPNLFQIFYTSKTRSADVKKGIGLGLTICETVVKAHGGTITGGNRRDGKGAEFLFTLPFDRGERKNVSGESTGN